MLTNLFLLSRSHVWHVWDRLGKSQLLYNLQVLHCLHFYLLFFPTCHSHGLLICVNYQHCQAKPCINRTGWSHRQTEENGAGRHQGESGFHVGWDLSQWSPSFQKLVSTRTEENKTHQSHFISLSWLVTVWTQWKVCGLFENSYPLSRLTLVPHHMWKIV